jgi:hypothetical protein
VIFLGILSFLTLGAFVALGIEDERHHRISRAKNPS